MEIISKVIPEKLQEQISQQSQTIQSTTKYKTVMQYIQDIGVKAPEEDLVREYLTLEQIYDSAQLCAQCRGREDCRQKIPGCQVILAQNRLMLETAYKQCKKDAAYQYRLRIKRALQSSRLPELFQEMTFDSFQVTPGTKQAYQEAQKFAQTDSLKGLVFAGNTGVGKSHLAAAIINEKLKQAQDVIFCTVPELLADIRRVIRLEQETSELMELVKNTHLLVLDDLGAEKTTEWVAEQLFVILNARLLRKKPVIITTNYHRPSDLIEKLGGNVTSQRIVSRIRELCMWIVMEGEDWRLKD